MTEKEINQIIEIMDVSFEITFKKIQGKIINKVENKIYQRPKSLYYDRTKEFKKAIVNSSFYIGEEWAFDDFFYNLSYIYSRNGKTGEFGHHKSFPWRNPKPDNETVKNFLPFWLSSGWTILGERKHEGYSFYPFKVLNGEDFLETQDEYFLGEWIKEFIKLLKKEGLQKYINYIIQAL